jgi:hypothetical protein
MKLRGKFAVWLMLLSPILQIYGWGQFDFAFLSTSLLGVYCFIRRDVNFKYLPEFLSKYIIYWMFIHVISATSISSMIPLGAIRCLITYAMFFSIIDYKYLVYVYKRIVFVCVMFFYVQFLLSFFFGYHLLGIIPYLPIAFTDDMALYTERFGIMNRPSSFFSEPAHFAQFLIPFLGIYLFETNKKKRLKKILFVVLALLLMQSGNALFGLSVLFIGYILSIVSQKKKNLLYIPLMIFGVLVIVNIYSDSYIGEKLLSRQVQISSNSYQDLGYSTSGFERIYRGYYVYSEYPFLRKVIGNDNPDYKIAASQKSLVAETFNDNDLYFNTVQSILLNTGIVGLLFFITGILGIWKKTNACGRSILAVFITYSMMSAMYFSYTMCLYLIIPYFLRRRQDYETSIHLH